MAKKLSENQALLEKIRLHYVDKLGREVGAMAAYARDLGIDSRYVSWWKRNDRAIPATYAEATEAATGGLVTAVDVVVNEIRDRKERKEAKRARWLAGRKG